MAYLQGSCDSYFVESHDERGKPYREALRERERHVKRQTQLAIAEELSQIVSVEYYEDVLEHMESMEVRRLDTHTTCANADSIYSSKHYRMLPLSRSKQRFNGTCVHTCLTS